MELLTASVTAAESGGRAYTLATLAGEIDVANSTGVRDLLEAAVAGGARRLVVDLSSLSFMDSSGLHALLQAARMLERQGGVFALAAPQGAVNRLLQLCAADQLMPVYDSVAEAADD